MSPSLSGESSAKPIAIRLAPSTLYGRAVGISFCIKEPAMSRLPMRSLPSLLVACCLMASPAAAQEKAQEPPKTDGKPSEAEMMALWMKAATPGKEHELLKKLEGKWACQSKLWMNGPDSTPIESTGTSQAKLIMGGRFLQDQHQGNMFGMPFEGMGLTGYDNVKKRYVGAWCDNFGTCLLSLQGTFDASGKTLIMYGTMDEFTTGEHDKMVKYVTRFESDDKYTFEIYDISAGEKKVMQTTCMRQK
jgi:hypothetical protein